MSDFRGKRAELNVYDDAIDADMQRVTLTLCYPIGTPNKNGTIFTHDAIKNAFEKAKTKRVPIVDYTDKGKIIGAATPSAYYDTDNRCSINYDCHFFNNHIKEFDMEYMINKFHKDQDGITAIDDFRIMGMSIMEDEI